MNDQKLESLLRAAGQTVVEPPRAAPELAARVRRLHGQRQRRRQAAVGLAAAAGLLGVIFWGAFRPGAPIADRPDPQPTPQRPTVAEVEQLKAEIAALDAEAERRHRRVEQMLLRQRRHDELAELIDRPVPPDPLRNARMEIERTAFLLVDHAQHRAVATGNDAAARQYRQVLELFPHTTGAQAARKLLKELSIENGDL